MRKIGNILVASSVAIGLGFCVAFFVGSKLALAQQVQQVTPLETPLKFTNDEVDQLWKVLVARNPDYQLMLKIQQQYFSQQAERDTAARKAQQAALDREIQNKIEEKKAKDDAAAKNPAPTPAPAQPAPAPAK